MLYPVELIAVAIDRRTLGAAVGFLLTYAAGIAHPGLAYELLAVGGALSWGYMAWVWHRDACVTTFCRPEPGVAELAASL